MKGAFIILMVTVGAGIVLYVLHRLQEMRGGSKEPAASDAEKNNQEQPQECCGLHITCEKDSLLQGMSKEIEYYDDEELDAFRGVAPDGYTDSQIEQFRDVLLTLLPQDIAGWARSLQMRGIELPDIVRQELLMLVAEARERR